MTSQTAFSPGRNWPPFIGAKMERLGKLERRKEKCSITLYILLVMFKFSFTFCSFSLVHFTMNNIQIIFFHRRIKQTIPFR